MLICLRCGRRDFGDCHYIKLNRSTWLVSGRFPKSADFVQFVEIPTVATPEVLLQFFHRDIFLPMDGSLFQRHSGSFAQAADGGKGQAHLPSSTTYLLA